MTLGQFVQPLSQKSSLLAYNNIPVGDPEGDRQVRGMLADAISKAPKNYYQGEQMGQQRALRQGTQAAFQAPAASASDRLGLLASAAGSAGDLSSAASLTSASQNADVQQQELDVKRSKQDQDEKDKKVAEFIKVGTLVQSAYQSTLKQTNDPKIAVEKTNELLRGLYASGIGDDTKTALQFFADNNIPVNLSGLNKSTSPKTSIQATSSGQAAIVDENTGEVKLVSDSDGNPIFHYVTPEMTGAKAAATARAKTAEEKKSFNLKKDEYIPATAAQINNQALSGRLITASDTGGKFIKQEPMSESTTERLVGIETAQNNLVDALNYFKDNAIQVSAKGRIPVIGEALVEYSSTPEFKTSRAKFKLALSQYIAAISGKVANEDEVKRLSNIIPKLESSDAKTVFSIGQSFLDTIESQRLTELSGFEAAGTDIAGLSKKRRTFNFNPNEKIRLDSKKSTKQIPSNLQNKITSFENKLNRKLTKTEIDALKKKYGE